MFWEIAIIFLSVNLRSIFNYDVILKINPKYIQTNQAMVSETYIKSLLLLQFTNKKHVKNILNQSSSIYLIRCTMIYFIPLHQIDSGIATEI